MTRDDPRSSAGRRWHDWHVGDPISAPAAPGRVANVEPRAGDWYGWQLLLSDLGCSVTVIAGGESSNGGAAMIGLVSYLIIPPVFHGAHDNAGGAALGVTMRLFFPIFGGVIGAKSARCSPNETFCGLAETLEGMALGALTAMAIDDFALAYVPASDSALHSMSLRPSTAIVRSADGRSSTPTFGVSGAF